MIMNIEIDLALTLFRLVDFYGPFSGARKNTVSDVHKQFTKTQPTNFQAVQ